MAAARWLAVGLLWSGYQQQLTIAHAEAQRGFANIPAKRGRRQRLAFSAFLYRYRYLIDRFFGNLNDARALATRYDKRPDNFLAAIKLFSTRFWINVNRSTA
jgi:transposase